MNSIPSPRRRAVRVLYVAAAGYGKSDAVEAALPGPSEPRAVVVDDLAARSQAEQRDLLHRELSADVPAYLVSRRPLAAQVRAMLPEPVFERGPEDLALHVEAIARVMRAEYGLDDLAPASEIRALTAGWPMLVHYACDALTRGAPDLTAALTGRDSPAAAWVRREVLAELPDEVRRTLGALATLDPVSAELAPVTAVPGASTSAVEWLRRVGILVPHPRHSGMQQVVPAVAAVVGDRAVDLPAVAHWYLDHGLPLPAARTLAAAGDHVNAREVVEAHADRLLAAGEARGVVEILRDDPSPTRRRRELVGDALRRCGDPLAALRIFSELVAGNDLAPSLAWRCAAVHYMLADYAAALQILAGVALSPTPDRDEVEVLALRAQSLSMLGAEAEAAEAADLAVAHAERLGDDGAAAAAYIAAATANKGVVAELHLGHALAAARRAGDVLWTARALLNQSANLLRAARYRDALEVAAESVRVAELGSPPGLLVVALHNLGKAERFVGRYDDAELHMQKSVGLSRERGLRRTTFGLFGLAEIYRDRGCREQALAAYRAAATAARGSGEVQALVPVLSGLARLLAGEDAVAARVAADEAGATTCPELAPFGSLAHGWVAVAEGDLDAAGTHAGAALSGARECGSLELLTEALELVAATTADAPTATAALREALSIRTAGGAEPAADRLRVLLARTAAASGAVRAEGRDAARRLLDRGVYDVGGQALPVPGSTPVEIRVFGTFDVRVGGASVPLPAWRSKQARTLVKILVSGRGRTMTRAELCEMLWPDDDPARTGHRLSVVLSAVRTVLDPTRSRPPDHVVAAGPAGLRLDTEHVCVDAEQFLRDDAYAVELLRRGDLEAAAGVLHDLAEGYRGDAFGDEPYEAWAEPLREECRAAYLRCLGNLAEVRRRAGEHRDASVLLLRILGADPYDESAHHRLVLSLLRDGRYGEARRAFQRWTRAMRDIDAPLPDPRILAEARSPAA